MSEDNLNDGYKYSGEGQLLSDISSSEPLKVDKKQPTKKPKTVKESKENSDTNKETETVKKEDLKKDSIKKETIKKETIKKEFVENVIKPISNKDVDLPVSTFNFKQMIINNEKFFKY